MYDMFLIFFGNEDLGKRTFLFLVLLLRELSTYATMKHFVIPLYLGGLYKKLGRLEVKENMKI
jgi:hypothetical protein